MRVATVRTIIIQFADRIIKAIEIFVLWNVTVYSGKDIMELVNFVIVI